MAKSQCQACPCPASSVGTRIQITNNTANFGTYGVYPKRPGFNCDSTCIITQGNDTVVYNIDGSVKLNPPINSESHWSTHDPNKLWGMMPRDTFGCYDISTQTFTPIYDAGAITGANDCFLRIGESEGSVKDDRCVVLQVICPSLSINNFISLDVVTGNVLGTIPAPSGNTAAGFSYDCSCIKVLDNGTYRYYSPDFNTLKGVANFSNPPQSTQHEDWVQASDGSQVTIVAWDQTNGWVKPDGTFGFLGNSLQNFGITNSGHVSGVASVNCPGLAFLSDTFPNQDSYLIRIEPDGNGGYTFVPLVNIGNIAGGTGAYEDQTKGTISPCGDYIMYSQPVNGIAQTFIRNINNSACPYYSFTVNGETECSDTSEFCIPDSLPNGLHTVTGQCCVGNSCTDWMCDIEKVSGNGSSQIPMIQT